MYGDDPLISSVCVHMGFIFILGMHVLAARVMVVILCVSVCYNGTSIIQTLFIWHLDYPDALNSAKHINMHTQRACLMTFGGVATVNQGIGCMNALDHL